MPKCRITIYSGCDYSKVIFVNPYSFTRLVKCDLSHEQFLNQGYLNLKKIPIFGKIYIILLARSLVLNQ